MFKLMNKQRNKKGFTLIELIVVIAILGILALIAIPRFSGFTERAKEGNDEQYASLVANSLLVIISSGDISMTNPDDDVTVSIAAGGGLASFGNISYTNTAKIADDAALRSEIGEMVAVKPLESAKYKAKGLIVSADDGGDKTMSAPGESDTAITMP